MKFYGVFFFALAIVLSGCANYTWKPSVPQENRSVFVAVFKNKSDVTGVGNSITRQLAREFQREGTYKLSVWIFPPLKFKGRWIRSHLLLWRLIAKLACHTASIA